MGIDVPYLSSWFEYKNKKMFIIILYFQNKHSSNKNENIDQLENNEEIEEEGEIYDTVNQTI